MATKYEYYNTGDGTQFDVYGSIWIAQTFTVGEVAHTILSVKLKLWRAGSPGTLTVSIKAVDENGQPTGNDLTSGTTNGNTLTTSSSGEWREISLTEIELEANTKYAIVARALNGNLGNTIKWRLGTYSEYDGGNSERSETSGSSWTPYSYHDQMFEVWGNPIFDTYTKTWQTDTLFKKLGITETVGLDVALKKQDIPEQFAVDADFLKTVTETADLDTLFKKLGIEKAADIDVLLKALGITRTADVDILFKKLDLLKTFGVDVNLIKQNIIKSFGIDAKFAVVATYEINRQIDALLKKLNITKQFNIDTDFKKLNLTKSLNIDSVFQKAFTKTFGLDVDFLKKNIEIQKQIDVMFERSIAKTFGLDVDFINEVLVSANIDTMFQKTLTTSKAFDAVFMASPTSTFGIDVCLGSANKAFYLPLTVKGRIG